MGQEEFRDVQASEGLGGGGFDARQVRKVAFAGGAYLDGSAPWGSASGQARSVHRFARQALDGQIALDFRRSNAGALPPSAGAAQSRPMDTVELKEAVEAEYPAIVALTNWAFRGQGAQASWNVEEHLLGDRVTEALLRQDLAAAPGGRLLIWRDAAGEHLGHVRLDPLDEGVWYLAMLTVRPDRQDRKLGRRLLAACEDYVRAHGGRRVRMTVVNKRESLIAWYQRRGYALTGETEPFPYGDDRFGVPTADDLCFVVLEREI